MPDIVIAVPTIEARRHRREAIEHAWRERTEGRLEVVFSEAGSTWSAGLNDVWRQFSNDPPATFVCGSDDMVPGDHRWLPSALLWLEQGYYPAPLVEDPRFANYGGHPVLVPDGTSSDMSSFPILRGDWLDRVFPLPDDLHYFADNLCSLKLLRAGIACVAVPSCRIIHLHAMEGRGAGFGTENTRLYIDTVRYTRVLEAMGVDRGSLPAGIRGHMFEERFQQIGIAAGA